MTAFRGKWKPWEQEKKKEQRLLSHGERAGMALCIAMLLFSMSEGDVPLGFLAMSFLVYEGYNIADKAGGERFHFLASLLKGLCFTLFAGSLILLFL